MNLDLFSSNPDQTVQIGKYLGSQFTGDELVLLSGDLGAGKTLLTKGIAVSLGIRSDEVVSPTFSILNQLDGEKATLFHIDLYRIGDGIGKYFPEIDDHLGEGVVVVEWAQYLPPDYFLIQPMVNISIKSMGESQRALHIESTIKFAGEWITEFQRK